MFFAEKNRTKHLSHSIFYLKRLVLHFVDFLNNIRIVMENLIYIQFFNKIFILMLPHKRHKKHFGNVTFAVLFSTIENGSICYFMVVF